MLLIFIILNLLFQSTSFPDTAKMIVSWSANSEADLKGYRVYYGLNSRNYDQQIDVGNFLSHIVCDLKFDQRYYVAVTAYDTASNESDYSDEVSIFLESPQDSLLGDHNNDGVVDFLDMVEFDRCFGTTINAVNFNSYFDFDRDGKIDFSDMLIFDSNFGKSN